MMFDSGVQFRAGVLQAMEEHGLNLWRELFTYHISYTT